MEFLPICAGKSEGFGESECSIPVPKSHVQAPASCTSNIWRRLLHLQIPGLQSSSSSSSLFLCLFGTSKKVLFWYGMYEGYQCGLPPFLSTCLL